MTHLSIELASTNDAAHEGRRAIRERFADVLPAEMLHDLALVSSELISNSVTHGSSAPVRLEAALRPDGSVFGEVSDAADNASSIPTIADHHDGLGLLIVDTIAARWGVDTRASTAVWFELPPYPRSDLLPP